MSQGRLWAAAPATPRAWPRACPGVSEHTGRDGQAAPTDRSQGDLQGQGGATATKQDTRRQRAGSVEAKDEELLSQAAGSRLRMTSTSSGHRKTHLALGQVMADVDAVPRTKKVQPPFKRLGIPPHSRGPGGFSARLLWARGF